MVMVLTPFLNKMESKHISVKFNAIDVDFFKNAIKRFNVESLPTIIIFKENKEIKRIVGVPMTSAVRAILNDIFEQKGNIY